MKIDGLPIGNNRPGRIDGPQKSADTDTVKRKAAAAERGGEIERDRLEVAGFVVEADFEPRTERLESVMQRLGNDGYRDTEVTSTIAERLVDADIASGIVADTGETHPVRVEHVERADSNVSTNYYDTEEVIRAIAERIAPALGLSGLFTDSSG